MAVTGVIGPLNIVVAESLAGTGARGSIVATGCPVKNALFSVTVLDLPIAAACSSLKISVLVRSDCPKPLVYPKMPDDFLCAKGGTRGV